MSPRKATPAMCTRQPSARLTIQRVADARYSYRQLRQQLCPGDVLYLAEGYASPGHPPAGWTPTIAAGQPCAAAVAGAKVEQTPAGFQSATATPP